MDVTVKPDGEARYIISCPDLMEWHARVDLVEALKSATKDNPIAGVILDLNQVSYINSAGLGAIFALRKHAKGVGAQVVVARPNATISRLLTTVNLSALMPVAESLEEARALLEKPTGIAD
jgi:anti-sigma B factor antagonist